MPFRARGIGGAGIAALVLAVAHLGVIAWYFVVGTVPGPLFLAALIGPLVLAVIAAVIGRHLPAGVGAALGLMLLSVATLVMTTVILFAPLLAAALPIAAVSGAVVGRHPVPAVIATFVLTGTYGTLTAYGDLPSGQTVDVLLTGLWVGALWGWFVSRHDSADRLWLTPGVVCLGVYLAFSFGAALVADQTYPGLWWFRASAWYLAAALLVAYAPWPEHLRTRIVRGVVVVALCVGGYASLRWLIGPSEAERDLALRLANNLREGDLRPVGSFTSSKELSAWCAIVGPFCFAVALFTRGRLRILASFALLALVVGMLGADVRAGPTAIVAGLCTALALFAVARALPGGTKAAIGSVAVLVVALAGTASFALTVGGREDTGRRYGAILSPGGDASVEGRVFKWRAALDDIDRRPFGNGAGTAGRTQAKFGRFRTVGGLDIDNSYLKMAYEQGLPILLLWAAGVLLTLAAIATRATSTTDPLRAAVGVGACATLASMLALFLIGDYIEGLPALAGWILVGLGLGQFTRIPRA